MRVLYWARLGLARAAITEGLRAVPGCELAVAETTDQVIAALPGTQALVLYDAPVADARRVTSAIAGSPVRWMHFVSAGREGFEAAGLPRGVTITYAAGAVAPTVAEHAMALLLALARRVPEMVAQQAERRWDRALATRALLEAARRVARHVLNEPGLELGETAEPLAREVGPRLVARALFTGAEGDTGAVAAAFAARWKTGARPLLKD